MKICLILGQIRWKISLNSLGFQLHFHVHSKYSSSCRSRLLLKPCFSGSTGSKKVLYKFSDFSDKTETKYNKIVCKCRWLEPISWCLAENGPLKCDPTDLPIRSPHPTGWTEGMETIVNQLVFGAPKVPPICRSRFLSSRLYLHCFLMGFRGWESENIDFRPCQDTFGHKLVTLKQIEF